MGNTSIALSDHWVEFTSRQVATGRYGSTSEVVRDALRLMEEREHRIDALRVEIDKGIASGPARPFDMEAFIARKTAESRKAGCTE
jgi:antitoxin ParD1/3/4